MKFWDTTIQPDGRILNRQVEDSQFGVAAVEAFRILLEGNPEVSFQEPIPAMGGVELQFSRLDGAALFTYWLVQAKVPLVQGAILSGRNRFEDQQALEAIIKTHSTVAKQYRVKTERIPRLDDRPAVVSAILPTGAALMASGRHVQPAQEGLKYAGETAPILAVAFFRELADQEGD